MAGQPTDYVKILNDSLNEKNAWDTATDFEREEFVTYLHAYQRRSNESESQPFDMQPQPFAQFVAQLRLVELGDPPWAEQLRERCAEDIINQSGDSFLDK